MASMVFTDAKILVGAYDLSGQSNEGSLTLTPEMLDNTTFGMTTKSNKPGLIDWALDAKGFNDYTFPLASDAANSFDSALFQKLGGPAEPFSLAPIGNAEGDQVFFTKGFVCQLTPIGAKIGGLMPFSLAGKATGLPAVRGHLLGTGAKTTSGNTTSPIQIVGGVSSSQKLYAAVHVLNVAGTLPTFDLTIKSAATSGFSAPTTRLTFSQLTGIGSGWQSSAGPITDEYFRAEWVIGGTTPSFTVFVVFGVF